MRKHHTRWVALCSATAISMAGLACLAGPAAADTEDTRTFAWPMVSQGVSSYSLDGYEITYVPPGLERYGLNATSTTDGQGDRRSQLSWVRGPDQLYGRVGVLRAERLQGIDDLRESRYSHLSESSLERLPESETFEHGAYLAEESGDLFWIDEPGVALTAHLQPDRWESAELVRLAESVTRMTEQVPDQKAEAEKEAVTEAEEAAAENHEDEAAVEEGPAAQAPDEEAPTEEAPEAEKPAEEAPGVEASAEESPIETESTDQTPVTEAPAQEEASQDTVPDEADPIATEDETPRAPVDQTPVEEIPDEEEGTDQTSSEEPAGEDETLVPDKAELTDGVASHEVKLCLTEHFVDFDSASSELDHELMTPDDEKFIARALDEEDLSDEERDRLLATVWYYGHEDDKVAAVDDCARRFDLERREVEDVLDEVDDLIAGLVQEADGAQTDTSDQSVEGEADEQVFEEEVSADVEDPIGEDEWEKLWNSLPWSVPTENP